MAILQKIPQLLATGGYPVIPAPLWTPAQLGSALRGWWDANTLGLSPGASVATFPSSGGVTNTLSQATSGSQPTYDGNFNSTGKGAISFDGVDDFMAMSDLSVSNAAPALVMWGLYKYSAIPADAQFKYFMSCRVSGSVNNRMGLLLNNTTGTSKPIGVTYRPTDASGTTTTLSGTVADTNPHLIIAQLNAGGAGAPKLDIWRDGTNILNNTPGFSAGNLSSGNSSNAYLGANGSTANTGIQGLIAQAGINRGVISTDDRQKLEGYLAWQGGIQGNLPPGHPYASAPPYL